MSISKQFYFSLNKLRVFDFRWTQDSDFNLPE